MASPGPYLFILLFHVSVLYGASSFQCPFDYFFGSGKGRNLNFYYYSCSLLGNLSSLPVSALAERHLLPLCLDLYVSYMMK